MSIKHAIEALVNERRDLDEDEAAEAMQEEVRCRALTGLDLATLPALRRRFGQPRYTLSL